MTALPPLRALLLAALCCLPMLRSVTAHAQTADSPASCGASLGYLMPALAAASTTPAASARAGKTFQLTDDITSTSDDLSVDLANGFSILTGNVDVHMGDRELQADQITHDRTSNTMNAVGQVRFRNPIVMVQGDAGRYADDGAMFSHAQFRFEQQPGYGNADTIAWTPDNVITVHNVLYTSCPPPKADWRLRAREMTLDTGAGQGVARGVRLEVEDVPVLYLPWLSFPLSDARKSGFLFPEISTSSPNGFTVAAPWYWNIAPNQDATITPTVYALRGLDAGLQYRYLSHSDTGTFNGNFLPDDQRFGEKDRTYVQLLNRLKLPFNTRVDLDVANVSDVEYFEDFTQGTESTSTPFLARRLQVSHRDDIWNLSARLQSYQTLDTINLIEPERPYMELPRIAAQGAWSPARWPLLTLSLDSEVVDFTRSCDPFTATTPAGTPAQIDGHPPNCAEIQDAQFPLSAAVNGWRLNARPQAGLDVSGPGYFFRPSVGFDLTQYELQDIPESERTQYEAINHRALDTSPRRALPIVDVDTGLQFERQTSASEGRSVTFEPRVMYVYIPYRDQSSLPVFDSATPDLNTIELFRPNRFVGIDRIGDSNSLTVGATTQWFSNASGARYLSATLAEVFYLQQPLVTAPDQTLQPHSTSSLIAEINLTAYRHWNVQADVASSPSRNQIEQTELMLQYLANNQSVVNVGYLYRYGVLQQIDGSAAWPVSHHWDIYARAVYSLFRAPTATDTIIPANPPAVNAPIVTTTPAARPGSIEDFAGIQYRGSCWRIRAIAQHSISTRTGQSDTGVSLQVELTGLSSVGNGGVGTGSGVSTFLEQSIRGYSASSNHQ
ncbi:MAG TPA: LPS assembly protein LptD [Steroidobacteraceae bacterium]|jgi:LPS-assembly protein|nr:LPS assembly protein LptD [Steroidobacteraceae bacterium]